MTHAPSGSPGSLGVSVVVRTIGSGRVSEALESLAAQEFREFEAVVVDMSGGRVDEVLSLFARRISLRRVALPGPVSRPAALNEGIRAAHAPLVAILDEDNLYDPGHLGLLVDGLNATAADYVYTGVRHATFTREGDAMGIRDVSSPWSFDRVPLGNFVYATGSAYRRALWEKLGGYDERFTVFEDWDFVIRAGEAGLVAHLPVISGTSRKFTGLPGVSGFELETPAARRCLAGIFWKHRRLFRGDRLSELKAAVADHCRARPHPRTGLLSRSVLGWRLELGWDLLCWWGRGLAPAWGSAP
jgi:glycosyltransferase involved in cell wall biosynthesis